MKEYVEPKVIIFDYSSSEVYTGILWASTSLKEGEEENLFGDKWD